MGLFSREFNQEKEIEKKKKNEKKEMEKLEKIRKNRLKKLGKDDDSSHLDENESKELLGKYGEFNDKFALKQFNFNDGLESVIEISYDAPRESKVKLFFSSDDFTTFSRNYTEKIKDNFVRLTIQPSTRANASLISGGNFDFNDSFDKGYTLSVSFRREDSKLLAVISQILRSEGFGCLPSKFSIIAHQNSSTYPTEVEAVELLTKLNYKISPAILEMK